MCFRSLNVRFYTKLKKHRPVESPYLVGSFPIRTLSLDLPILQKIFLFGKKTFSFEAILYYSRWTSLVYLLALYTVMS